MDLPLHRTRGRGAKSKTKRALQRQSTEPPPEFTGLDYDGQQPPTSQPPTQPTRGPGRPRLTRAIAPAPSTTSRASQGTQRTRRPGPEPTQISIIHSPAPQPTQRKRRLVIASDDDDDDSTAKPTQPAKKKTAKTAPATLVAVAASAATTPNTRFTRSTFKKS